jgi:ABC-type Zn uptake system ZnuABC Zn-binding protein ZnuA
MIFYFIALAIWYNENGFHFHLPPFDACGESQQMFRKSLNRFILLLLLLSLAACAGTPGEAAQSAKLKVIATTTIVGDVVKNIGGDLVQVDVLLPPNSDPHTFEPNPKDEAKIADARVIFMNGAGLEEFMTPLLENSGGNAQVVPVSDGIPLIKANPQALDAQQPGEGAGGDPHTYFDPNNVIVWSQNIEKKLSAIDPAHAQIYAENSQKYQKELRDLDAWIKQQVAQVPEANRKLVSDHTSLTYFAGRYGFEQVGAVIPSYSTLSSPSAKELASLEDAIRKLGVKAVFVENSVNPALAQRVAQDTGVKLVNLYNGALSGPDGPASTYMDFIRYDVTEIVNALK